MGPQGSGKGTQGKIVAERLGFAHISTGDLLRGAEGDLKKEIDSYINEGNLAPDELILRILQERIKKDDCSKGFILDGYPRNLQQAQDLKEVVDVDFVVEITLGEKESIKRLSGRCFCEKCGKSYNSVIDVFKPKIEGICDDCGGKFIQRADDYPEAIKKRLEIYRNGTGPILDFYEKDNTAKVFKIDGEQSVETVTEDLFGTLKY